MEELKELLKTARITADIHIEYPGIRGTGTPEDSQQARDIIEYLAKIGYEAKANPVVEAVRDTPSGDTVDLSNADGTTTEWIVLTNNGSQAELITADVVKARKYHHTTPYPKWSNSDIRKYLNGEYYNSLAADVRDVIKTQTLTTATDCNWGDFETTEDNVYLLAESNDSDRVVTPSGCVFTKEQLKCPDKVDAYWYWLRSPRAGATIAGIVSCSAGTFYGCNVTYVYGVRPAITIDLSR